MLRTAVWNQIRRPLSARTPATGPALHERLPGEPWVLDRIALERPGDEVTVGIEGWAFPDASAAAHPTGRFLGNGRPFDAVTFSIDRPDVGEVFWH